MREMAKTGMDTWPRDDVEKDPRMDKNKWNIKGRLRDRSKQTKDYKSFKQSQCLTKDTLDIDDLSLHNRKIVFPQNGTVKPVIPRCSSVENVKAPIQVPLRNSKRRQSTKTLSNSKHCALTKNATNSWGIKYDPILKAEALRNAKNYRVSLKKLYDRNANIVSVCDKSKTFGINNLEQETEDKYVSLIDLNADSNHGFCGWNTSIVSNNTKYDPCISFNTCKDERKSNESTDIEHFERRLKRLSTTITLVSKVIDTPGNGTPNEQISDTSGNQNLKEKSTVLERNKKQDLLLKEEAKDRDSVLNRIPCENVGKTRKTPIVTETTVLPTNTIKIRDNVRGTDLLGPKILLKSSPEFKISKSKSYNTHTEINKAVLLNIGDDNVFKKSNEKIVDNSVVEVKDSVKKNCTKAKANNNNKDSSTVKTIAWKDRFSTKFSSEYSSIRDNKTNALPAQALPTTDCATKTTVTTNKCSTNVSTATWTNTESSLSSNNALKQRADHGIIDRQKIVCTKEETEKINTKAEDLYKKVNLSKKKRANSNQSIGNEGTKRIKLDRSVCLKNFGRKRENDDVCDNTGSVVASSTAGTVPRMVLAGSSEPTIVAHVPETKSKNEKDILNLVEAKASTSFASTNKKDSDSLQNVWKPSEITSETLKSPVKHKFIVAGKRNCNSKTAMDDEDTDTDCISLYADSTLMEEYDSPVISTQPNSRKSLVRSEKPYSMTDKVFHNYYESTTSDFNKAYDTINANSGQNTTPKADRIPVVLRLGLPVTKEEAPAMPRVHQNPPNYGTTNVARQMIPRCFQGYCYRYIRTGNCDMEACKFKHNFLPVITKLYMVGDRRLFEVIDNLVLTGFLYCITNIYEQLVTQLYADSTFILKVLKRLYELNITTDKTAEWTFLFWERMNISMEIVVNNLARIVDHNDSNFVNWIIKILQNRIIHHINNGTYWNTLKGLLLKVPNLEPEIISIIIRECVTTRKNVRDVHRNVVIKLDNKVRSAVDQRLWLRFNNLLKCTRENNTIKERLSSQSDIHIPSPDVQNPVHETESPLPTSQHSVTIPRKVWTQFTPKTKERDDNNNTQNESLVLQPIDDLPEPHSPHGRRIFCQFYLDLQSLQKGLEHDDYDHVARILNAAKRTDKTVFSRECYKILCKEVKCSQSRLSKLISFAVQIGATPVLYEILLDVAIHILARLAEMELWVLALKLLEDVDIMIKMRIRLQEIDAVTLLLLAEIYLANDQPVKAFTLLKQTNIISTNRSKWETPSNAKDDCIRAQVVALLLDRLCEMSPHHAIFLLEFLVDDQSSNFSPVDLTRSVNKIVPVILLEADHESIVNLGKLIDNNNFTLNTITHRALTAALVHIDKGLAMQFYQNAIGLGIYSTIRFHPATYVIIHSDWTNEEIYLVILDLMQQLSSNLGHAIDRISLKQLSIYVHFETIPSETQLACDRGTEKQNDNKIIETKKRMATILEKQFEPPILFAKSRNDQLCKLQNTSVRRYLQCEHPR